MEDPLIRLRQLPKDIFTHIHRLIVERVGLDEEAFMRTLDIVGYVTPKTPYQLAQPSPAMNLTDHQDLSTWLIPAKEPQPELFSRTSIPPRHICFEGHWDQEEYIKITNANILGGMGTLTLHKLNEIHIPVIDACEHSLAFYHSTLVSTEHSVCFESEKTLPMMRMHVGTTYTTNYLMQPEHGHGSYLEYHNEPHFWMPLSEECSGFLVLGREIDGKYFLTGFKIPYGYAVYTSPDIIHSDAYLVGEYLTEYTLADHYSTVIVKSPQGELVPFIAIDIAQSIKATPDSKLLWQAAAQGDLETLNHLLQQETTQQIVATSDNAALREAAFNGHLDIVEKLLQFEAVRQDITAIQNGALALAARNGHSHIVDRLLQIEAVRNEISAANNKAFNWAAANGHLNIVERLLQFDSVQDSVTAFENAILRETVKMNQRAVIERLLQIEAVRQNIHAFDNEALKIAVAQGHVDIVDLLLSFEAVRQPIEQACKNKELLWIVKNGHLAVIQRLLALTVVQDNIAELDNEILRYAVAHRYFDVAQYLLQLTQVRQNAAASANEALRSAAKWGSLDMVNALLHCKTVQHQITACDNEALREAVIHGHLAVVNRLLEFGAVQQDIAIGYNEIYQAAVAHGHVAIIERLLQFPEVQAFESKYHFQKKFAQSQAR